MVLSASFSFQTHRAKWPFVCRIMPWIYQLAPSFGATTQMNGAGEKDLQYTRASIAESPFTIFRLMKTTMMLVVIPREKNRI